MINFHKCERSQRTMRESYREHPKSSLCNEEKVGLNNSSPA